MSLKKNVVLKLREFKEKVLGKLGNCYVVGECGVARKLAMQVGTVQQFGQIGLYFILVSTLYIQAY